MSYIDFITPAINLAREAAEFDEQKNYKKAYEKYLKSVEHFMTAIKRFFLINSKNIDERKNPQKKDLLKKKAFEIMDRAEQIKTYLKKLDDEEVEPDDATGAATKKNKKKYTYFYVNL